MRFKSLNCLCPSCALSLRNDNSGGANQTTFSSWPCLFPSKACILTLISHIPLLILDIASLLTQTSKSCTYPKHQRPEVMASLLTVIYKLNRDYLPTANTAAQQQSIYTCSHTYIWPRIYGNRLLEDVVLRFQFHILCLVLHTFIFTFTSNVQ